MRNDFDRPTPPVGRHAAFTLIELLVVIAIIALLIAILLPVLSQAREVGKRGVCLHNHNQLAIAWNMYSDGNEDRIVNGGTGTALKGNPPWPWGPTTGRRRR